MFSGVWISSYRLVTSQERWLRTVLPRTLAHCHWYLELWLQIQTRAPGGCWCQCPQPGHAGCSKASPPCPDSLRHGCPLSFGQSWKWSQHHPLRGCTLPNCPPYRGQCGAARKRRKREVEGRHWSIYGFSKNIKKELSKSSQREWRRADCTSNSKVIALQRSEKHNIRRKIQWFCNRNILWINKA